jgi:hypothetical protein
MSLAKLTTAQLKKAIAIREKIDDLESQFSKLLSGSQVDLDSTDRVSGKGGKRTMSDAGRARIAAAQRARWARLKGAKSAAPAAKAKSNKSA